MILFLTFYQVLLLPEPHQLNRVALCVCANIFPADQGGFCCDTTVHLMRQVH